MAEKEIGKVTHWYDNISVAVLALSGTLKVGDKIKVRRGETEFESEIKSIQINHQNVASAKKGDEAAVELPQKAKEGSAVFLLQ